MLARVWFVGLCSVVVLACGGSAQSTPSANQDLFETIELRVGGLCQTPCNQTLRLGADGQLSKAADAQALKETFVTTDELKTVEDLCLAEEFRAALKSSAPCSGGDSSETMRLGTSLETLEKSTAGCNGPPYEAVRRALSDLAHKYFPAEPS